MHRPESNWDSNFRIAGIAVVWFSTGGMLVGAAVFDAAGEADLMLTALAIPFALTLLLIGGLVHAWRHVVSSLALLALWYSVLPTIRWGPLKGFYMDCARIEPGMPVARAAEIMSPYLLMECPVRLEPDLAKARQALGRFGPPPDAVPDRIVFIPDLENGADWCMVYASGRVVRDVEVSPD